MSRVALCFFALVRVVLLVRGENCHMLRLDLHCFVSVRFALLCLALYCIAHFWNGRKANPKYAIRHASNPKTC